MISSETYGIKCAPKECGEQIGDIINIHGHLKLEFFERKMIIIEG